MAMLLVLPALLLLSYSCGDDDKEVSDFKIIKTDLEESPVFLKGTIELSSADFEFTVLHDWCKVARENNILKIEATENYDFLNRSTEIVITSGDVTYRVPITQTGILFEFTDDKFKYLSYSLMGGDRTIRLIANVDYEISIPEKDKEWLSIEKVKEDSLKIVVAPGAEARRSNITFKYFEKEIKAVVDQYNYLSYVELLGPAQMTYTNSKGERVETEIVFEEKVKNQEFYIRGTFESGIERRIPLTYIEEREGELRFSASMLLEYFEDPEKDSKIKALATRLVADNKNNKEEITSTYAYVGDKRYYPASFNPDKNTNEGVVYEFISTKEGFPDYSLIPGSILGYRTARGIEVCGTLATGRAAYGTPYDVIYHIEIVKKKNSSTN